MASALTIFGAVGTSVALLNLARQGFIALVTTYKDFKHAGDHIAEIQRHFNSICFLIELWSAEWGFDQRNAPNDEIFTAFWGERGWQVIKQQLAAVDIKCEDLAAVMSLSVPPTVYDGIPEDDRRRAHERLEKRALAAKPHENTTGRAIQRIFKEDARKREVRKIRVLEHHISQATTPWEKAKFVFSSSERLQKYLEALHVDFEELVKVVDKAWRSQHPGTDLRSTPYKQRWTIALARIHKPTLMEARNDRSGSKALLTSCFNTKNAFKLEMNLLKNTTAETRCKSFHLLVPRLHSNVYLEMSATCLGESLALDRDGAPPFRQRLLDACERAETSGTCLFRTQAPAESSGPGHRTLSTNQPLWFSIRKSSEIMDPKHYNNMVSLSKMVEDIEPAEQLEIAYKVVESSLLLLGTSWLSALSSMTLMRFKIRDQEPRYILPIKEDMREPIQTHIFNIGALLVEIALRNTIADVRSSSDGRQLVFLELGRPRVSSLRRIITRVKDRMGVSYAEAVEFCLQDPVYSPNRDWERGVLYDSTLSKEEVSLALLELYFEKVLIK